MNLYKIVPDVCRPAIATFAQPAGRQEKAPPRGRGQFVVGRARGLRRRQAFAYDSGLWGHQGRPRPSTIAAMTVTVRIERKTLTMITPLLLQNFVISDWKGANWRRRQAPFILGRETALSRRTERASVTAVTQLHPPERKPWRRKSRQRLSYITAVLSGGR